MFKYAQVIRPSNRYRRLGVHIPYLSDRDTFGLLQTSIQSLLRSSGDLAFGLYIGGLIRHISIFSPHLRSALAFPWIDQVARFGILDATSVVARATCLPSCRLTAPPG